MGQKKKAFRYLEYRVCFLGLVNVFFIGILALDWEKAFAGQVSRYGAAAAFVLLELIFGYYRIYQPYHRMNEQFGRFAEGYIALADLCALEPVLSPDMEQLLQQLSKVVDLTRNMDLSKRQAQYRALQNQINPHFLYNTLEGIRSEALIAGLDSLADMTESLAIFFRYTISKVEDMVTLEEELDNCQTYFRIQEYRFGSRIHLKIVRDEEEWDSLARCRIPKLTLQPILENSIIHGIELKMGEGTITIDISRTSTRLIIRVADDGVGMDHETLERLNATLDSNEEGFREDDRREEGGVALANVNNRVHLMFGEEYGMHVFSMVNRGTTVELTIPVVLDSAGSSVRA